MSTTSRIEAKPKKSGPLPGIKSFPISQSRFVSKLSNQSILFGGVFIHTKAVYGTIFTEYLSWEVPLKCDQRVCWWGMNFEKICFCLTPSDFQVRADIPAVFIDSHYKKSSPVENGNFSAGWLKCYLVKFRLNILSFVILGLPWLQGVGATAIGDINPAML